MRWVNWTEAIPKARQKGSGRVYWASVVLEQSSMQKRGSGGYIQGCSTASKQAGSKQAGDGGLADWRQSRP